MHRGWFTAKKSKKTAKKTAGKKTARTRNKSFAEYKILRKSIGKIPLLSGEKKDSLKDETEKSAKLLQKKRAKRSENPPNLNTAKKSVKPAQ